MKIYHATTPKKAQKYHETGYIRRPVRGFSTLEGAKAWAWKVGRSVILELEAENKDVHKLPDHHNRFGVAHWIDRDVAEWACVLSPERAERIGV